jgi:hypothetical protein
MYNASVQSCVYCLRTMYKIDKKLLYLLQNTNVQEIETQPLPNNSSDGVNSWHVCIRNHNSHAYYFIRISTT